MSKYEIGQQIPVGGIITITGAIQNKQGTWIYNTDRKASVPEYFIESLEMKPLEKAQPEQPKQEPVKLYCVRADEGYLTKDKIYEMYLPGRLVYDSCETASTYESLDALFRDYPAWKNHLVPLVKRPAKVGEWVYICNAVPAGEQTYKNGDVFQITHMHKYFSHNVCNDQQGDWFEDEEYLVLDGYKPEPEYFSGKVVCVDTGDANTWWTRGKVYEYKDGFTTADNGQTSPFGSDAIKDIAELENYGAVKFIEFKGE